MTAKQIALGLKQALPWETGKVFQRVVLSCTALWGSAYLRKKYAQPNSPFGLVIKCQRIHVFLQPSPLNTYTQSYLILIKRFLREIESSMYATAKLADNDSAAAEKLLCVVRATDRYIWVFLSRWTLQVVILTLWLLLQEPQKWARGGEWHFPEWPLHFLLWEPVRGQFPPRDYYLWPCGPTGQHPDAGPSHA